MDTKKTADKPNIYTYIFLILQPLPILREIEKVEQIRNFVDLIGDGGSAD